MKLKKELELTCPVCENRLMDDSDDDEECYECQTCLIYYRPGIEGWATTFIVTDMEDVKKSVEDIMMVAGKLPLKKRSFLYIQFSLMEIPDNTPAEVEQS